jgi:hypothetical protein
MKAFLVIAVVLLMPVSTPAFAQAYYGRHDWPQDYVPPAASSEDDDNAEHWVTICERALSPIPTNSRSDIAIAHGVTIGLCVGAVANVLESFPSAFASPDEWRVICWTPPSRLKVGVKITDAQYQEYLDLASVAARYLRDNPQYAKLPYEALLLAAFMRHWPCGQCDRLTPQECKQWKELTK